MVQRWKRYALVARVLGVMVILGLLGVIGYQLYDFYSDKVGFTAVKAIEAYFNALAQGNYQEVYRLTAKEDLTDIYGRRITEGEFIEQLKKLTGGHKLPLIGVESKRVFLQGASRYYVVTLRSTVGGAAGQSRLLVEVRRKDKNWVVTYPFAIVL